MEFVMNRSMQLLASGAIALSPSVILAHPGNGGGAGHGATMSQGAGMGRGGMSTAPTTGRAAGASQTSPTTRTSQGSTHGAGWDHMNGPTTTGQPGVECEETRPGNSATAPGSAFNEDGKAGTRYAGEQPQNSRNTASISQYDVACTHQPQH
jgi:hypothetical protein